jgi:enoyl-CoA hydratase/carnithine racemase
MKKSIVSVLATVFLAGLTLSCATTTMYTPPKYKPSDKGDTVIGSVQATFEAAQSGSIKERDEAAYLVLLEAAKEKYPGNIDIRDITYEIVRLLSGKVFTASAVYEWKATGKVVSSNRVTIDDALNKAVNRLIEDLREELPRRTTVAILSVYTDDRAASTYTLEKIEQQFYDARHFTIIEKRFIDDVRRDKRLQESDDIDPAKAAELAREEGWNVVVIGEISGSGSSRRLTLRAIDAEKATILSRAMESF